MDRHLTLDAVYVLLQQVRQGSLTREMGAGFARERLARVARRQACFWPREDSERIEMWLIAASGLDAVGLDDRWRVSDAELGRWIERAEAVVESVGRVARNASGIATDRR